MSKKKQIVLAAPSYVELEEQDTELHAEGIDDLKAAISEVVDTWEKRTDLTPKDFLTEMELAVGYMDEVAGEVFGTKEATDNEPCRDKQ